MDLYEVEWECMCVCNFVFEWVYGRERESERERDSEYVEEMSRAENVISHLRSEIPKGD